MEILQSLTDEQLQYRPNGEKWQPLYWEFGCIGRTQIVYTQAIRSGKMDFSLVKSHVLPDKHTLQRKKDLKQFLIDLDKRWVEAIREKRRDEEFTIRWPGFKKPLVNHMLSLAEHERLHHGQLISYFTLAGFALPKSFTINWALA